MLLAIVIQNLIWAFPVCLFFGIIGYAFRGHRLNKLKNRISELESEMLQNHAEILTLQKENAELVNKLKNNPSVPVIPITGTGSGKENTSEGVPDVANRKKLLGSSSNKS
jgi:hypothetical protein